ncbi:OmpA family protein [Octadecabacter sp. 1_MG-2023]|uniref:OmpA family protein n=1 Tax=unclassified Octadecabacter TaxID=196158 RepID=UPI001C09A0F0|nr:MULTISPECIES: OmpA family protein [unclassified Octadecabacter]MBU2994178.1 OmpA family protein [Octadecabacter sp. B2R22]MDO6734533.1 OmpA family protein [Octadecabacter sp. 1_MG-2023]
MRLSTLLVRLGVFLVAAILCGFGARIIVSTVEARSVEAVEMSFEEHGHEFATVIGDGLQVILEGEAPSEAMRFRAISTAGGMVDASRVIDNMTVTVTDALQAPEFSMEILRNDSGISIIGLIPTSSDRDELTETLADLSGEDGSFADFLETADHEIPSGWDASVDFALRALRQLPRSKISVRAGSVAVEAISDSPEQKAQLETSLRRTSPEGLLITLDISAPRPVVSPFVTRFIIDGDGARFDSCVADTVESERRIVSAAQAAGAEGRLGCTVALGSPTVRWADAVTMSIAALKELGGGTVTFSDADVTFVANPGAVEGNFDRIAGELENSLPEVFALEAILPAAPSENSDGPPQFIATLSPEGLVQLRGRVSDDLLNSTAENFARAKFGSSEISMATRVVDGLPNGWAIRVLAGVEALSKLSNGSVTVEPESVVVRGNSGSEDAGAEITRLLIDKLGSSEEFEVDVTYVEALDPIASLPTEEECLAGIEAVTQARKITFEPSSATIAGAGAAILDDIAEVLQRCADLRVEIAGYTDSQGSEDGNQRLSQQRADAVLDGLRVRRVPVSRFRAVGYGEADPIADNETAEGREANRRIEFSLIIPESTEEPTALEQIEAEAEEASEEDATE